jgi:hypothetical protein
MKKIGCLFNDFSASQAVYTYINNANQALKIRTDLDFVGFFEELSGFCLTPNFACMNIHEAWSFDGTLIATNLNTAQQLIRLTGTKKKFFYIWDLEWMRLSQQSRHFRSIRSVYANPQLKLLARGEDHKKVLEDCWNLKVYDIIEDFDIDKIASL